MARQAARATGAEARRADFVSSLAKGLELLAAFERGALLGNQELVERTGMPKATVSRLTGTLASLGYLMQDEHTRKYQIGARVLGLGASVQRHIGLQRVARPFIEALAHELDVTVILGARDRLDIVFLEIVRPPRNALTVNTDAGSVVPLGGTAIGLAYLVAAPVAERVRLLQALQRRHAADAEALRRAVERAHADFERYGFVISERSWDRAVNAVGVPLALGAKGVFTFACAGASSHLPRARMLRQLGPRLVQTVAEIRQALAQARPPRVLAPG